MAEATKEIHHLVLAKFKEEIPPQKIEELIKGYANLVEHIPHMKAFHWGKDVSIENLNQGFTHIFHIVIENSKSLEEYVNHPAHVEFGNLMFPVLDKVTVVDFSPSALPI
ncbi:stress-response A/B barrel domain-containing protein HS1-like [Mercurialis annua]|uniref:stress-response A/B barrel domain-containing protein HS1-like n=1 Tax=Mercurialis annua TaxID=3986 RepID=UPI00215E53AC|nr:stress-response A/B barrel domain-containing protein HS1-like [Mercurialis annua]